ncbi:Os05g0521450 [Oryza sativa Japonica Group]|uniref:Os05g0521450 protein n=1 Tax=Oryza sativa subsp. japonica TaxID=39947 RepID=A0A0N7KL39_ORYSJ|nr:hypothetical protein EE612_030688 [Oryza sativa]BAS94945.1 Os05g0521450 [Oryza sativa Japonica Group]
MIPFLTPKNEYLTLYRMDLMRFSSKKPHHLELLRPGIKPNASSGMNHILVRWQPCDCPCSCIEDVVSWRNSIIQEGEAMAW